MARFGIALLLLLGVCAIVAVGIRTYQQSVTHVEFDCALQVGADAHIYWKSSRGHCDVNDLVIKKAVP